MKVKITFLTENDIPVSELGENPEREIQKLWELFCAMLNIQCEDTIRLEKTEILGD